MNSRSKISKVYKKRSKKGKNKFEISRANANIWNKLKAKILSKINDLNGGYIINLRGLAGRSRPVWL